MKIGLFGGTFDPIHIVHLMVAEYVHEALDLDEIWFMPAHVPPHKEGRRVLSAAQRLEMVHMAIQGVPYFRVFPFELDRPGPSYTVDTIKDLKRLYPIHHFHFIIGGDMIDYLPHWHKIDDLVKLIRFAGVPRPGYTPQNEYARRFVDLVDMPQIDISSSLIRERLKRGATIRYMLPEAVRKYIEENNLYGSC
jgi:nicotinate-nucleotide adenylyltransferase